MWPRTIELMLGLWLVMSPLIFRVPATEAGIWAWNMSVGVVIMTLSVLAYIEPLRRAHLGTLGLGVIMAFQAFLGPRPLPSWQQSALLTGLLIGVFALVPTQANLPPRSWRGARPPGRDPS